VIKLEKLEKDKIFVIRGNWGSREELIMDMKEKGIKLKCFPVSLRPKKGGEVGPALEISFTRVKGEKDSAFKGETKKKAIEWLGLRTEEDCERVNRELEN
jgi:hypothetical protein